MSRRKDIGLFGVLILLLGTVSTAGAQSTATPGRSIPSPFERISDGPGILSEGALSASFSTQAFEVMRDLARQEGPLVLERFPLPGGREESLVLRAVRAMPAGAHAVAMHATGRRFIEPRALLFSGSIPGTASTVFLGLTPTMFHGYARVDGELFVISSGGSAPGTVTIAHESALHLIDRAWCEVVEESPSVSPPGPTPPSARGGPSVQVCDVFIECDHQYRGLFSSDQDAADYAALLVGATSEIYRRDLGVILSIPDQYLRIWNVVPPWGVITGFNDISNVQAYWTSAANPLRDLPRASVHVLTTPVFGGVAWNIGGICDNSQGYEVSSVFGSFPYPIVHTHGSNWDLLVVAHEFGHSFGSPHTFSYNPPIDCEDGSGPDQGTLMGYCHLDHGVGGVGMRFHARVQEVVRSYVESRTCPVEVPILPGDYDIDGSVDATDLAALAGFLAQGFESAGVTDTFDMNADGELTGCDYAILDELIDGNTRSIYLFADPQVANVGDDVDLTTCEGSPGLGVLLYVEQVDGVPFLLRVGSGVFDLQGTFTTSGTIPPGLAGVTASFRSYAFDHNGKIVASNDATLTVQ